MRGDQVRPDIDKVSWRLIATVLAMGSVVVVAGLWTGGVPGAVVAVLGAALVLASAVVWKAKVARERFLGSD